MPLQRTPEPEVMDTVADAVDYDGMDHSAVNRIFAADLLAFLTECHPSYESWTSRLIVDLGTGTIRIPLELSDQWSDCGPVLACDLSIEMLKLGLRHVQSRHRQSLILPVFCDAKRLPFASRSVHVVMSNSIIHHIPDPLPVFRESRRCLKFGGQVFFRDLLRPETEQQVEDLVATYAGNENPHSQLLFRESLHAAFTIPEINEFLRQADLTGMSAVQTSDRHWTVAGTLVGEQ